MSGKCNLRFLKNSQVQTLNLKLNEKKTRMITY